MSERTTQTHKVFVSYSHDSPRHVERVFAFSERLRALGFDCRLDQHVVFPSPGWDSWVTQELETAHCVVVVCSRGYLDRLRRPPKGGYYEGAILPQTTLQRPPSCLVPVLLEREDAIFIPEPLKSLSYFLLSDARGLELLAVYLAEKLGQSSEPATPLESLPRLQDFARPLPVMKPWRVPGRCSEHFTGRDKERKALEVLLAKPGQCVLTAHKSGLGRSQLALDYLQRHGDRHSAVLWLSWGNASFVRHEFRTGVRALGLDEDAVPDPAGALRSWLDGHKRWLLILDAWPGGREAAGMLLPKTLQHFAQAREAGVLHLPPPVALQPAAADEATIWVGPLSDKDALALLRSRTGRRALRKPERDAALDLAQRFGKMSTALDVLGALAQQADLGFEELRADLETAAGGAPLSLGLLLERCAAYTHPALSSLLALCTLADQPRLPLEPLVRSLGLPGAEAEVLMEQALALGVLQYSDPEHACSLGAGLQDVAATLISRDRLAPLLDNLRRELRTTRHSAAPATLVHALRMALENVTVYGPEEAPREPGVKPGEESESAQPEAGRERTRKPWLDAAREVGREPRPVAEEATATEAVKPARAVAVEPDQGVVGVPAPPSPGADRQGAEAEAPKAGQPEDAPVPSPEARTAPAVQELASSAPDAEADEVGPERQPDLAEPVQLPTRDEDFLSVEQWSGDDWEEESPVTTAPEEEPVPQGPSEEREEDVVTAAPSPPTASEEAEVGQAAAVGPVTSPEAVEEPEEAPVQKAALAVDAPDEAEPEPRQRWGARELTLAEALGRAWQERERRLVPAVLPEQDTARGGGVLGKLVSMLGRFFFRGRRAQAPVAGGTKPAKSLVLVALAEKEKEEVEEPVVQRVRPASVRPPQSEPDLPATFAECLKRGDAYREAGRLREAEPFYARALQLQEKLDGEENLETARIANLLGELYRQLNELELSEPLLERALAIRVASWGDEHAEVAQSCTNLGSLRRAQGRRAEAEALYVRALRMDEALFGPDHPNTATDCNNLAVLYFVMERYAEALRNIKRAMAIREAALGKEHPQFVQACENCAAILRKLGRSREAEEIMQRVRYPRIQPDPQTGAAAEGSVEEVAGGGLRTSASEETAATSEAVPGETRPGRRPPEK